MIDPSTLRPGDRVSSVAYPGIGRAFVEDITENYVKLNWGLKRFTARGDMILKTSPLWQLLEYVS